MQSRYYDPELGRFINADAYASTGQGVLGNNMFAYCLNNPITYADPSGHFRKHLDEIRPVCIDDGCYYIYDQNDPSISSLPLGKSTIGKSGCGVVASYNAMLDLGEHVSFESVYSWYINHLSILDGYGKMECS